MKQRAVPNCAGEYELFDSTRRTNHAIAASLCADCPVFEACDRLRLELLEAKQILVGTRAGHLYGGNGKEVFPRERAHR